MNITIKIVILATLYYLLGKLSSLLAIPPGFASPVWLPSGLALAALLIYGKHLWPGIAIGSFFASSNLIANIELETLLSPILINNTLIGLGASLQAIIGCWLIQHFLPNEKFNLESGRQITLVLLLGIFSCSLNAIFGAYCLFIFDFIQAKQWPFIALNWWVGDSIGVIVLTPVLLLLNHSKKYVSLKRKLLVSIPMLLLAIFLATAFSLLRDLEKNHSYLDFNEKTEKFIPILQEKYKNITTILSSVQAYYNSSKNITEEEFITFTNSEIFNNRALLILAWLSNKGNDYHVEYINPSSELDDSFINSFLQEAFTNHIPKNNHITSNNFLNNTMLLTKTIYKEQPLVQGIIAGVVDINTLIKQALAIHPLSQINLTITDTTDKQNTLLYGEPVYQSFYHYEHEVTLGTRIWNFQFDVLHSAIDVPWHIWSLLIGGMLFIGLLGAFALLVTGQIEIINKTVLTKTNELQVAIKEATKANQAKSGFLSNMSHEIRTPLTAILGNAEILSKKTQKNRAVEEYQLANRIVINADHLLYLVNDILDFSKIEANKLVVEKHPFNIYHLLNDIINIFKPMADNKHITFSLDVDENLPKSLSGDSTRIKQIAINLLSNAFKFTKTNGVVSLRLVYKYHEQMIAMDVADTGIGIPQHKLETLFNAFVQVDDSTTRRYGGTGLGLSICKQLCILMGGDLTVTSEENVGSTFSALLKIPETSDAEKKLLAQEESEQQSVDFTELCQINKPHILVADDWQDNQKIISWHLENLGATFTIVDNGEEAVQAALKTDYDLVLMDIQMPILDGMEATKRLRGIGYEVPIIAVTANAMKDQVDSYLTMGFSDFLSKPFKEIEFKHILKKHLSKSFAAKEQEVESKENAFEQSPEFQAIKMNMLNKLTQEIEKLQVAYNQSNIEELVRFTHSLKSSLRTFGFPEPGELSAELEQLFSNDPHCSTNKQKLDYFIEQLQVLYDQHAPNSPKNSKKSC